MSRLKKKSKLTLNVHGYEHKIRDIYQKCLSQDQKKYEEFDSVCIQIVSYIKNCQCGANLKDQAIKSIDLIKKGKISKKNHDKTNLIIMEDLLPRIWDIVRGYESSAQVVFIEQLADMSKGSCSQGRNIRLVQFYIMNQNFDL